MKRKLYLVPLWAGIALLMYGYFRLMPGDWLVSCSYMAWNADLTLILVISMVHMEQPIPALFRGLGCWLVWELTAWAEGMPFSLSLLSEALSPFAVALPFWAFEYAYERYELLRLILTDEECPGDEMHFWVLCRLILTVLFGMYWFIQARAFSGDPLSYLAAAAIPGLWLVLCLYREVMDKEKAPE